MEENKLDFLLGALSPTGFCGYYAKAISDDDGKTAALLKAAPGCGKSTLLKRVADELVAQGEIVELIHCSQDPQSLDGVICKKRKFVIVDATAPHAIEAEYPIAFEDIISLYSALNRDFLQEHRKAIVGLFKKCKGLSERASRYITAAGSLLQDSMRVALSSTDIPKAQRFALNLCSKYFPKNGSGAQEDLRLLSAITLDGLIFYDETATKLAKTLVVLDDEFGAASKAMLHVIRTQALKNNHKIITCYCSMSPYDKIEHIFLPELSVGFVTNNHYHAVPSGDYRTIHCSRFCDNEGIKLRRKRLKFNKKAIAELFMQACLIQGEAKTCHDELEEYYIKAIDFAELDKAFDAIMAII